MPQNRTIDGQTFIVHYDGCAAGKQVLSKCSAGYEGLAANSTWLHWVASHRLATCDHMLRQEGPLLHRGAGMHRLCNCTTVANLSIDNPLSLKLCRLPLNLL